MAYKSVQPRRVYLIYDLVALLRRETGSTSGHYTIQQSPYFQKFRRNRKLAQSMLQKSTTIILFILVQRIECKCVKFCLRKYIHPGLNITLHNFNTPFFSNWKQAESTEHSIWPCSIMIYQGEDKLVAKINGDFKLYVQQNLLEFVDVNGDLWQLNFDFTEYRKAFLVEYSCGQLEIVRTTVATVVDEKDKLIAAQKRKINVLEDALEDALNNIRQGTSKLAKLVDHRQQNPKT